MSLRRVFQAREQVAVRALDRDAAEHRDRAGRRDRRCARAPAAFSSIAATCGTALAIVRASRLDERERRRSSTSGSTSSSAAIEQDHPRDRRVRRGEQDQRWPRRGRPARRARQPAGCSMRRGAVHRARDGRSRRAGRARGCRAAGSAPRRSRRAFPRPTAIATLCQLHDALRSRRRTPGTGRRGWSGTGGSRAPRPAPARARTRPGPSTSASSSSTAITVRGVYPSRRRSAISRRRCGHGQQHRVEREQEPHERADHREQRG